MTTDVRGERRFISTIARRLDSLGALTRGQRQTGGQNLFNPADNLESSYAKEALTRWFHLLFNGKLIQRLVDGEELLVIRSCGDLDFLNVHALQAAAMTQSALAAGM